MPTHGIAQPAVAEIDAMPESPFHIPATDLATRARCTLKYGDTFAVFDSHGDIGASSGGPDGLFHNDTRFLSRLNFSMNGYQPLLLGFSLRDDNTMLTADLTNPDICIDSQIVIQQHTLHAGPQAAADDACVRSSACRIVFQDGRLSIRSRPWRRCAGVHYGRLRSFERGPAFVLPRRIAGGSPGTKARLASRYDDRNVEPDI